jgi:hypothetical protein
VICKDNATGGISDALKVDFTVKAIDSDATSTDNGSCAALSSNDRKSDAHRSYLGNAKADSVYLWQAVETGTRDKFPKVDWYAGYQITPGEDGRITQVCGYFESGVTNRVSIYNGAYKELVGAEIAGSGAWKCADITPLSVKTDSRYYVIARAENNPIYFEYKTGIFPKSVNNAVIEAGIRQAAGVGLVDIKISYPPTNTSGPAFVSTLPSGLVAGTVATLAAQTDQDGECKYDREDVAYALMNYSLARTAAKNFGQKVCNLESGNYTFYIRCKTAAGAENNASAAVQFEIAP